MKTFAWKTYDYLHRRIWYDRHYRMWTMQTVDAAGNQTCAECSYGPRHIAFAYLYANPEGKKPKLLRKLEQLKSQAPTQFPPLVIPGDSGERGC